ncbi:hypothetical protein PROSTU_04615 [Providencia stuartii ATCC 25827]|uniref:Uncharacterized protein n=1 Tax=Providencia stuartii ATCC 25827 TaxID=471874 RepID=A0AA86YVZ0_PROST|nr:hypothetical protein PROSTU_04615 [Providencia stuartii ATCC 25827]
MANCAHSNDEMRSCLGKNAFFHFFVTFLVISPIFSAMASKTNTNST